MSGLDWFADIFRLAWGLLYWNTRKAWFRYRRGRSPCPCQNPSDSGRAYETGCEAAIGWNHQRRFRRICPLLVETPEGLRCSVDTAEVRPFWGAAARYYGGALLVTYSIGVLSVFIFLRTIGYPVSIVHVGLPPLWHKVGQARGWYFVAQANHSFSSGRTAEGLLYLASAYEYDPANNYEAGLALAKISQAGQTNRSDDIFQRLLRDHPDKRSATAEHWFRALLPRGDFPRIARLTADQVLSDPERAHVWIRALLFATRRTADVQPLRDLLASSAPAATLWHSVLEIELLMQSRRFAEARTALEVPWLSNGAPFSLFYRVNCLIELGAVLPALDLLARHPRVLDRGDEAALRLDAFAVHGATANLNRQLDELLAGRFDSTSIRIICAHLIRHPNQSAFDRLWDKMDRLGVPINDETAGSWFSVMSSAGAVGDTTRLHQLVARLKSSANTPFVALGVVEAFFLGELTDRRITVLLPLLPLPLEVTYALLERYPPPPPAVASPAASGA